MVFSVLHKDRPYQPFNFDLRVGLDKYTRRWLLLLRECIEYEVTRKQALLTFSYHAKAWMLLLETSFKKEITDYLSPTDLLMLSAACPVSLKQKNIRSLFRRAFDRPDLGRELFDSDVSKRAIDVLKHEQDSTRSMVTSIVTKAMSAPAYASLWAQLEIALSDKKISNSHFVYFAVQATTNARDANLWPCKVSDLVQLETNDLNGNVHVNWYLRTYLAKSRLDKRQDEGSLQPLPKEVGDRLDLHRKEVIARLGPHFPEQLNQIGLFSSFYWVDVIEGKRAKQEHFSEDQKLEWYALMGRFGSPTAMRHSYFHKIKQIVGAGNIGAMVVRHTVGTYLARLGYDARTIARILQHTDSNSAQFYVDICFAGVLDEFGHKFEQQTAPILGDLIARVEALICSNDGSYDPSQLIQARVGNNIITAGACKTKRCEGVPYQCYLCPSQSFVPFLDGDHQAILDDLTAYRDEVLPHQSSSFRLETENINTIAIRIEAVIQACWLHQINCSVG